MKNSRSKEMTKRYEDYFKTSNLEERAAKTIYYWVMSTIESIFWGLGRYANMEINLHANESKIILWYNYPLNRKDYEYVYYPTFNCSDGKLEEILQKFVKIFNTHEYPYTDTITYPVFHANYIGKKNQYECIVIYVDISMPVNN